MAKNEILIRLRVDDKGNLKVASKDAEKLSKSTDKAARSTEKLNKSRDKYNRTEKGVAGISSNSTKNFSKMQQSIGGEGGSGGLVRAYALLAANVFALTAAFGVLSRASQVEVLITSIERLEVVSGKSITNVGRDLQAASRGALDFASSLRSVSLATSAGFNSDQIARLGEVATNASISLGRNLADGLDRIFRGVIKVEPELLDEIGLFVRVNEAASKYAADLGVAATDLTEFQRRQAFANEALEQGEKKFGVFADIDPAPLDRLSASLIDISQSALGFVTDALNPLLNFLINNSSVLIGVFGAIVFSLLRQVVPALGTFALNATQAAEQAQTKLGEVAKQITAAQQAQIAGEIKVQQELKKTATAAAEAAKAKRKAADSGLGGQAVAAANQSLNRARSIQGEINALEEKSAALERSRRKTTEVRINKEQAAIKAEIAAKQEILRIEQQIAGLEAGTVAGAAPVRGSALELEQRRASLALFRAQRVEIISNTAATKGLTAGLRELGVQLKLVTVDLANETILTRAASRATIAFRGSLVLLQTAFTKVLGALTPLLLVFSFLPAILEGFKRLIGASTEATDKFNEATEKSSDLLDSLGEKLEQTRKTLADTATGAAADADALQAQANALSEQANALIEARRALEAVQAEREGTLLGAFTSDKPQERDEREFLKETLKQRELSAATIASLEAAGFTNLQRTDTFRKQITDSLEREAALLNEAKRLEDDRTVTGDAYVENLKKARDLEKQAKEEAKSRLGIQESFNTLLDQIFNPKNTRNEGDGRGSVAQAVRLTATEQTNFATASANIDSALEGAKESAREFRKAFITKTVVDKPLTSLLQITTALQEQSEEEGFLALDEEERKKRFDAIVEKNSAVLDLLDKQTRENLINAKTDTERLSILEGAKTRFLEQQVILGRNKGLLKELNTELKLFDNVTKNTNGGIATANILRQKALQIEKETLKVNRDHALQVAKITQETLDEAVNKERAGELESFLLDNNLDRNAVMKAITAQRELENKETEITIASAQALREVEKSQFELRLKTISAQEKLNKAIDKTAELRLKAQNIARGRGADLTPGQELQLQIESFNRAKAASDEKLDKEQRIAKIQLKLLDAQAKIANDILIKRLKGVQAELELIEERDDSQKLLLKQVTEQINARFETQDFAEKTQAVIEELAKNAGNTAREILNVLNDTSGIFSLPEDDTFKLADNLGSELQARLGKEANEARKNIRADLVKERRSAFPDIGRQLEISAEIKKLDETTNEDGTLKFLERVKIQASAAAAAISQMADGFLQFGADGAVAHAMADFTAVTLGSIEKFADGTVGDKLQATAQMLGGVANILNAQSDRRIANIDKEIEAEKKRDGKSAESVKKIQQLEKKKEQIARKQFEMQKKMQIAQTIASTAAAVMQTLAASGMGFFATPLAMVVAAMGAAQVALIARQKFEGGSAAETASAAPSTISLGERTNEVNVANQASRGELAYLRGEQGRGSISNFTPAAAGRKGYANGSDGVVVGERGPEIITPSMPVDIIPNDQIQQGITNVNFTIHAVDAAGLEQTIQSQRGNIIGMIRDAANGFGEPFLEGVDTDTLSGDGGSY